MAQHLLVSPEGYLVGVREYAASDRVYVARSMDEAREWHDTLAEGRPLRPDTAGIAVSPAGMAELLEEVVAERTFEPDLYEEDWERELVEDWAREVGGDVPRYRLGEKGLLLVACSRSFRTWLNVWHFVDLDTGVDRVLGDVLWSGQKEFVRRTENALWIFFLKNRQIGYTAMAVAYDAWVLRFRAANARVHLVSRTETVAKNTLLKPLKYGVKRLPEWMQLPMLEDTTTTFVVGTDDDRRTAQAYPAKEPGRAETCSHLHLDEWAAMAETGPELPKDVWLAAEPTVSKTGGTCHILCTGVGPVGYYADVWRLCVKGEGQLDACFIPATGARPEYTAAWLADKKARMGDDTRFGHEYPERWEDALSGAGGLRFRSADVDAAGRDFRGFAPAGTWTDAQGRKRPRRYVKAWDIAGPGERSDAVVGVVVEWTEGVFDVRALVYNRGEDYPITAARVRTLHAQYPGVTVIEDNEAGAAVRSFLGLPDSEVLGFRTTRLSKPVIIEDLAIALQSQTIKWDPAECPELDAEVRGYMLPDDNIDQDTVMALAIALHHVATGAASRGSKMLGVAAV